jgi:tRNA(Ile)-lysidine synthetase-like protein
MIKIQGKIPREVTVACSGGVDSMAVVDFLRRSHDVTAFYFNHGTEHGFDAKDFLEKQYTGTNVQLVTRTLQDKEVPKDTSQEEHWRNERYKWFHHLGLQSQVITCHHLDDCVETWVWSSMHGASNTIPYRNISVIRPFRLTRKREFITWCHLHDVPYIEDDSNKDLRYTRNYIRHEMMPHVLRVNPGIHKMLKKKMIAEFTE